MKNKLPQKKGVNQPDQVHFHRYLEQGDDNHQGKTVQKVPQHKHHKQPQGPINEQKIHKTYPVNSYLWYQLPDRIWHPFETPLGLCLIYIIDQHRLKV